MQKMNYTNNQTAFEYAIYEIVSSYYDEVKCSSPYLEKNMYIQFKEQKNEKQEDMEQIVIGFMNKRLRSLPRDMFKENTTIRFKRRDNGLITIYFVTGGKYVLELNGVYAGKKSTISCVLWSKKTD